MKHINVYVTIHGERKIVGTFDLERVDAKTGDVTDLSVAAEIRADHATGVALQKLSEEGRDVSGAHVEKVYVDTAKLDDNKQPLQFVDSSFRTHKE